MTNIIDVFPDWYEDFDNAASFKVLLPSLALDEAFKYEEQNGQYIAVAGDQVRMFAYSKPGEGYGGRKFVISMLDGSSRTLIGPWSSGAYASNSVFKDHLCTDCSITDDPQVMQRGHTFSSGHILISSLVEWYVTHRTTVDWGLYAMADGSIQPSKGRFVKNGGKYIARLFPQNDKALAKQYAAQHQKYFMEKVSEFWSKCSPIYGEVSGEQRAVIEA
jgi:hypothetical protein